MVLGNVRPDLKPENEMEKNVNTVNTVNVVNIS
jgi:hypothetical protein